MAEPIPADAFLQWGADAGIGFHPDYPGTRSLVLLPPRDSARFWGLSGDPASWPHFAAAVLEGLDPWSEGFLWPWSGRWLSRHKSSYNDLGVREILHRGAGIPESWPGAVRFKKVESDSIIALMFAYLAFGGCQEDDLYFIPDHGQQIVQTSHHDVIHVECVDEERVQILVEHMEKEGYSLPTEPPDETFKWPGWMPRIKS